MDRKLSRTQFELILFFAILALGVTIYMIYSNRDIAAAMPGCGPDSACDAVMNSPWSMWGPIPVAWMGLACYLVVILAAIWIQLAPTGLARCLGWGVLTVQSVTAVIFIAWLFGLQWLWIGRFCMYCLTAHCLGLVAFISVLRITPVWRGLNCAPLRIGSLSTLLTGLLIAGHILLLPDPTVAQGAEELGLGAAPPAGSGGLRIGSKAKSREVTLLNQNLTFDLYKVPIIGDPEAPHVLVDLYDYPCPSCRELHRKLKEFAARYPDQIVVVSLPVPMNPKCNPEIKFAPPGFKYSCDYARLAMAVAKADAKKFALYHDFLLGQGSKVPKLKDARAKAEELIGKEALETALKAPEVEQWIQDGISVHTFLKGRTIPKLIVKDTVITYSGSSRKKLFEILERELKLTPPAEK